MGGSDHRLSFKENSMTPRFSRILSAVAVSMSLVAAPAFAQSKDEMKKTDSMSKDTMGKPDKMTKPDTMSKDAMDKKDAMGKSDGMSKDGMAKDTMKK
jgi:pentapeptide MXKDX repeat protein